MTAKIDYNKISEDIQYGESILFLGAGFSREAKDISGDLFLDSKKLSKILCDDVGIDDQLPLGTAANFYYKTKSGTELIKFIRQKFTCSEVKDFHNITALLNWRRVYTTNYDDVLEVAGKNSKKLYRSITLEERYVHHLLNENLIIHINGFVNSLNEDNLNTTFKLGDSSYLTDTFKNTEWYQTFKEDLRISKSIIFLGYSMYDLDIARILAHIPNLASKSYFVIGEEPDRATEIYIEDFGKPIQLNTKDFINKLCDTPTVDTSSKRSPTFHSFKKAESCDKHTTGGMLDVFNLFFLGKIDTSLVEKSILFDEKYFIKRPVFKDIADAIENNTYKNILIDGELGTGKTLILEGIRSHCNQNNIPCFTFFDEGENFDQEIEWICACSKSVVIIENHYNNKKTIKKISRKRNDQLILITTGRTPINDVTMDSLLKASDCEFKIFHTSILETEAIPEFIGLLDSSGLWGQYASYSPSKKRTLISKDCHSSFSETLLKVIESEDIKNRLDVIFTELGDKKTYHKILITILVLNRINVELRFDEIVDLLESDTINSIAFKTNHAVSQFISLENNCITAKSSILASFLIKNIIDKEILFDIMVCMYKNASKYKRKSRFYSVCRELDTFSKIQTLLPKHDTKQFAENYFEAIKDINDNIHNHNFWLQYAISQHIFNNFSNAQKYFETSYSLAKEKKYDLTLIDNHYARYMLKKAYSTNEEPFDYQIFIAANTIIQRQIHDVETRHHPFRAASEYRPYYETFGDNFSSENQVHFAQQCNNIIKRISQLNEKLAQTYNVRRCEIDIKLILKCCNEKLEKNIN